MFSWTDILWVISGFLALCLLYFTLQLVEWLFNFIVCHWLNNFLLLLFTYVWVLRVICGGGVCVWCFVFWGWNQETNDKSWDREGDEVKTAGQQFCCAALETDGQTVTEREQASQGGWRLSRHSGEIHVLCNSCLTSAVCQSEPWDHEGWRADERKWEKRRWRMLEVPWWECEWDGKLERDGKTHRRRERC